MPLRGESPTGGDSESFKPIPQRKSDESADDESENAAELLPLDVKSSIAHRVTVPRSRLFYQARYQTPVVSRIRVRPGTLGDDSIQTKVAAR